MHKQFGISNVEKDERPFQSSSVQILGAREELQLRKYDLSSPGCFEELWM
jgi:hypothetical protein